jgi:hypothetical protein
MRRKEQNRKDDRQRNIYTKDKMNDQELHHSHLKYDDIKLMCITRE